MYTSD